MWVTINFRCFYHRYMRYLHTYLKGGISNKDILQLQWGLTFWLFMAPKFGTNLNWLRIWCKNLKPSCHVGYYTSVFREDSPPNLQLICQISTVCVFFHFGAAMTVLRSFFRFFCPFLWFNDFKPAALKCIDAYLKMDPKKRIFRSFLWTSLIWGSIFHLFDFVNTSCTSRFNNAKTSCCQNGV